ncbi:Na(+)-translocating NADH-quinone reductase subunit C [Catenovulum sp. 2E275]|uniref:Na(+)-translocating NADH-quinone reductase subunit C n=1 Tax=Catenovulum sp. 2E275 TaxID=2980497 RepID=UPI0021D164A9|nr:Na(+)-translocating NADH-quinone reductase subunit C [Catenovulum sp. 2E275]MCU4674903.1 Na(+)-translocating NADH-quinone reductase subunit C [Catenovulum sp. 2E275]
MSKGNDSISKTLTVVISLCLVCAVIVAGSAVALKPKQEQNRVLDKQKNILIAANLLPETVTAQSIQQAYKTHITAKIVDLDSGEYVEGVDAANFDQRASAKNPETSINLTGAQDVASIKRRSNQAVVYLAKDDSGKFLSYILPVHGYGLWSTMYAFVAVKPDANTIINLNYYEQGETPGLGAEIENPKWKSIWVGKKIYNDDGEMAISIVKGEAPKESEHKIDGLSGATLTGNGVQYTFDFWMGELGFKTYLEKQRQGA